MKGGCGAVPCKCPEGCGESFKGGAMTENGDAVWGGNEAGGSVVDTHEKMCGGRRKEDGGRMQ